MSDAAGFQERVFTAPPERTERVVASVLRRVEPARVRRVLEVGSGTGDLTLALAAALPEASLTGVDISPGNVEAARANARARGLEGRVRFEAADYLVFRSEPADLVVSDTTLHLVGGCTSAELFRKLATDLAPGGALVATLPYACAWNALLFLVRRAFRLLRGRVTDALVGWLGHKLHPEMPRALLLERVHYMYVIPERVDGRAFREAAAAAGLSLEAEEPVPHASLAQPKHRLVVFRKSAAEKSR